MLLRRASFTASAGLLVFWGREDPGFPAKLARMALVKKVSVKSGFSCTPYKPLATSLSTDLLAGFKGLLLSGWWREKGEKERKGREGSEKI